MDVKWERQGIVTVGRVQGRIDGSNFSAFQRALDAGIDPAAETVVLDFEQVAFISSAGLRVIIMLGKELKKRRAQLALCTLRNPVREIFSVSGFDQIIPIHDSESEAISALAGDAESPDADAGVLSEPIDFDIVGDNLKDIAGFTIEKYEYINDCKLSPEARRDALVRINAALWRRVEQSKRERLTILKTMFTAASEALDSVVDSPES